MSARVFLSPPFSLSLSSASSSLLEKTLSCSISLARATGFSELSDEAGMADGCVDVVVVVSVDVDVWDGCVVEDEAGDTYVVVGIVDVGVWDGDDVGTRNCCMLV